MTLYDDNLVYDRLTLLAACLCAQIQDPENGVPDVCFCGIVPGDAAVGQYAGDCSVKCGMAWVRMVNLYPSQGVGQATMVPGNCGRAIGIDVELGIMRCISVGDERGNLPSPAELLAATQLQIADALIMHKAVYCCDALPKQDVIVGEYTPLGPEGGLVGGSILISVAV